MHFLAKFPACTGHLHALNRLRSTRHAARQVRCHSSSEREVPPPDVRALAELAHISITDEQVCEVCCTGRSVPALPDDASWHMQAADWEPKIRSIVDWWALTQPAALVAVWDHAEIVPAHWMHACRFGELQTVDVSNVPPAIRADVDAGNVLRADVEQQFQQRDELLEDVPDREGPFVRVPKVAPAPTS